MRDGDTRTNATCVFINSACIRNHRFGTDFICISPCILDRFYCFCFFPCKTFEWNGWTGEKNNWTKLNWIGCRKLPNGFNPPKIFMKLHFDVDHTFVRFIDGKNGWICCVISKINPTIRGFFPGFNGQWGDFRNHKYCHAVAFWLLGVLFCGLISECFIQFDRTINSFHVLFALSSNFDS